MNESKKIYAAISAIMSEVGIIAKTRQNSQGSGYMFRGIDDVYAALQPLLHKHKVFFVPFVIENCREERQSKSGGNLIYTVLKVQYTFFAEDGSSFFAVVTGEAMDSSDKSCNKAMSAALKVCCLQVFCIPTEEEKDTEYHSHDVCHMPGHPASFDATPPVSLPTCELCATTLVISKSGSGYYCPNFKHAENGEHTRFPVSKLEEYRASRNK